MDELVYYNELYDLYGVLLTDKQRDYFEDYYFHNLSYSEMADNYKVSRNAMFKQIHNVLEKLDEYEEKLHLREKKNKLLNVVNIISDDRLKKEIENIY